MSFQSIDRSRAVPSLARTVCRPLSNEISRSAGERESGVSESMGRAESICQMMRHPTLHYTARSPEWREGGREGARGVTGVVVVVVRYSGAGAIVLVISTPKLAKISAFWPILR